MNLDLTIHREAVQLKEKLARVEQLMQEKEELKAQIKKASAALQAKTKNNKKAVR
jgi:uncharacterized protein (UPF0335 family)